MSNPITIDNDDTSLSIMVNTSGSVCIDGAVTTSYGEPVAVGVTLTPQQARVVYDNLTKVYKSQHDKLIGQFNDQLSLDFNGGTWYNNHIE